MKLSDLAEKENSKPVLIHWKFGKTNDLFDVERKDSSFYDAKHTVYKHVLLSLLHCDKYKIFWKESLDHRNFQNWKSGL